MMQARMRQMSPVAVIAVTLIVILGGTARAQSDPLIGTWKLNVAKSKFVQGPTFKSLTLKFEAVGTGVKTTADSVAGDGTVAHSEYTANYDGKDNPVTGNSAIGDMAARTRINATTTKAVYKRGGKITQTNTQVVSSDGKTLTVTGSGTSATGQTINGVLVLDKQ